LGVSRVSANLPASPAGIRIVVVDDGTLNRECLAAQLAQRGITATGAWDLPTLLAEVDRSVPHVVLINIATPDSATLLQLALDLDPGCRVIVYGLSVDRESEIVTCAEAGIAGLHLRTESFDSLLSLIGSVGDSGAQCSPEVSAILLRRVYAFAAQANPDVSTDLLTPREIEILELIDRGLTNQQIASRLSLTLHTVKNHVHNLLGKLGVASRAEAVAVFRATKYANPGGLVTDRRHRSLD
jgi:DNA-binding NarL/FixJ family response regulator